VYAGADPFGARTCAPALACTIPVSVEPAAKPGVQPVRAVTTWWPLRWLIVAGALFRWCGGGNGLNGIRIPLPRWPGCLLGVGPWMVFRNPGN